MDREQVAVAVVGLLLMLAMLDCGGGMARLASELARIKPTECWRDSDSNTFCGDRQQQGPPCYRIPSLPC